MKTRFPLMVRLPVVVLMLLLAGYVVSDAKEYVIGVDDVLEIGFWQNPGLDTRVKVGRDGKISLDIIGQIDAAGKTNEELEKDVVRQISRLNKNISQAVVRVVEYNYNHVYVIGQVTRPGKISFEEIPDLWTIINESGGITEYGDLSRVTIIRGAEDAGQVVVVNVNKAIASGQIAKLPKIRRMDTIEIPRLPAILPPSTLAQTADKKNVVYVVGAVNAPGAINYEDNMDILEVLALAGGPTDAADLRKTHLIIQDGDYAQTITMNLEEYAKSGRPARYTVQREDTFVVPVRRPGFLGAGIGTVVAVLGAVATVVIIYDRLSRDDPAAASGM